ncbi:Hypothetical protein R9X50_00275900 [Acrodontium crateriforme]|uniref:Uncharacterized protein n=1 Tax=Acrodontium crateriforme TaxID=150365 RepID=A0AAQ3M1H0_9PEZI|nr:Hypothetical protein R9X50_00275900 [Acrodontium crateriforme]
MTAMIYLSLVAASLLAANAFAAPTTTDSHRVCFTVGGTSDDQPRVAAQLESLGSGLDIVLKGVQSPAYPGTPAKLSAGVQNSHGFVNRNLTFSPNMEHEGLPSGSYGASTSDPGIIYGKVLPVTVNEHGSDGLWQVSSTGQLTHARYSDAFENFFACDKLLDQEGPYLMYGMAEENGQAPAGCSYTSVYFH